MSDLTADQIEHFREQGYLAGLTLLSEKEVACFRPEVEKVFSVCDPHLHNHILQVHTVLPWAYALATRPALLDRVESVLGADLLLWKSKCFVKFPGSTTVPWHQDLPHWDLQPPVSLTAWIALTASHVGNGCVRVVPESHRRGSVAHGLDKGEHTLLTSGLHIDPPADADTQSIELQAGEMSLHDGYIVHGSDANVSTECRIGVAFVFVPAVVRQRSAAHGGVMLVRGADRANFFSLAPPPIRDEAAINRALEAFTDFHEGRVAY